MLAACPGDLPVRSGTYLAGADALADAVGAEDADDAAPPALQPVSSNVDMAIKPQALSKNFPMYANDEVRRPRT
jgi:hypothetical protein